MRDGNGGFMPAQRNQHVHLRLHRVVIIKLFVMLMLGAAVALGTAGVALASTGGRQSVPPPVTTPQPPGGFTTVVTTVPIGPAGGVVGPVLVNGAEVTVDVPAGAFAEDVQITITMPDLGAIPPMHGFAVVAGAGVGVSVNGAPYPGTFLKPVTVSFNSPAITAASAVVVWNGSAFVTDPSSTTTAGHASVSFDTDPAFAVESPTTQKAAPVPGATSPVTGQPFLGEGILAGVLLLGGTGGLVMSRRRRVKATSAGPVQELPARDRPGVSRLPRAPRACLRHISKRRRHSQEAVSARGGNAV